MVPESNAISGTATVLGIRIHKITTQASMKTLLRMAGGTHRSFVTYVNAACVDRYFGDAAYARLIDEADLVYADGQAIVWASRFLGQALPERVNAGDFFEEFCRRCATLGIRLFFLGSKPGIAQAAAARLKGVIPELQVVGTHHGFLGEEESAAVVAAIKEARPHVLVAGMGVPLQEKWVARHREALKVPVCWCVGALFEYLSGQRARAPMWMRKAGLEWLFRLMLEPGRMWRRYLIGNIVFLWRVLRYRLRGSR
jgi:N-acetylglucosaminyldiphosphoundecaprenol N-acetyl-beta-D-mannosaminyltransferase